FAVLYSLRTSPLSSDLHSFPTRRSSDLLSARLKPVEGGPYPTIRIRIGRFVALDGAVCWPAAVFGALSPPAIAPATASAVVLSNCRLNMSASTGQARRTHANVKA